MCQGRRYSVSPICGLAAPSATAMGKCSSLGDSGVSSGCPTTTQVGTPASADTALWPASQVTIPACGRLTTRVTTRTAGSVAVFCGELRQAGGVAIDHGSGRDPMDKIAVTKAFVRKRGWKRRRTGGDHLRHVGSRALQFSDDVEQTIVAATRGLGTFGRSFAIGQIVVGQTSVLAVIVVQSRGTPGRHG